MGPDEMARRAVLGQKSRHGGRRAGAGKPKGTKWPSTKLREDARRYLSERVRAEMEALATAQIDLAKAGNHSAIKDIFDREFGKPVDTVVHTGMDGGPIVANVILSPKD